MTIFVAIILFIILYAALGSRISRLEREILEMKNIKQVQSLNEQVIQNSEQAPMIARPVPVANSYSEVKPVQPLTEETGGKVLAILGVIAVFIGLAFFLKFAFDNNLIGVDARIILGYLVGILAIILGLRLRGRYAEYADTLTGGGIAVLYLITYAAYDLYHLFSNGGVYGITVVITIVAVGIGVYLASEALVALAFIGAFASPLVMSLYKLNLFPLLGYLLIISLGNAVISYWYKWSRINLIGISGSFLLVVLASSSIALGDSQRTLIFLFLSLYFIIFLVSSIMHHVIRREMSEEVDGLTVAMNGLAYGAIGYMLLHPLYPEQMGYFMLAIAVIYFLASLISFETNREDKLMNIVLPAMAALFLTIAIPIHFKGAAIPTAWLTEALLMFIIEYSVRGKNLYLYGLIVYIVGLLNLAFFHLQVVGSIDNFTPIFNQRFMLFFFAAVAGYVMAYIAHIDSKRGPHATANEIKIVMAGLAEIIGLATLTLEIQSYYDKEGLFSSNAVNLKNTVISVGWVIYATLLTAIGFAGRYRTLRLGGLFLFFLTAFKIFIDIWALGPLYRIVASIVFGVLALLASFAYTKFKDRLFAQ